MPVSTSYIQPLIGTESGINLLDFKNVMSSLTLLSSSGKAKKSNLRDFSSASASGLVRGLATVSEDNSSLEDGRAHPRFFATRPYASSFLKVSMPQPVCLTSKISLVPSSCSEMMMLRRASTADAPAYRSVSLTGTKQILDCSRLPTLRMT